MLLPTRSPINVPLKFHSVRTMLHMTTVAQVLLLWLGTHTYYQYKMLHRTRATKAFLSTLRAGSSACRLLIRLQVHWVLKTEALRFRLALERTCRARLGLGPFI